MQVYKSHYSPNPLQDYINKKSLRLTKEQDKLIERTFKTPGSMMLGSLDELQHIQLMLRMMNAKYVIELGCFTGYSALTMALALPRDGKLITCDIRDTYVAQDIWREAGVDGIIELKVGPAANTLKELLQTGNQGRFDFIFVDADKDDQLQYYELSLKLLRKGGVMAIDNVLWVNIKLLL